MEANSNKSELLLNSITGLRESISKFFANYESFKKENYALKNEVSIYKNRLENDSKTIEALQERLLEFETKSKSFEDILSKQRSEISELQERLFESEKYIERYKITKADFESYKESRELTQVQLEAELNNKNKIIENEKQNFAFLQKELTRRNFEFLEKDNSIKHLKEQIAELDSRLYLNKDTEKAYLELKSKYENQIDSISQLTQQRDNLLLKLKENSTQNESNRQNEIERITSYKNEIQKQALEIRALNEELLNKNEEKLLQNKAIQELEQKLNSLNSNKFNLEQELDNRIQISNKLINELESYKSKNTELIIKLNELESINSNNKAQLEFSERKELEDALTAKNKTIEELNTKVKQLTSVSVSNQVIIEQLQSKVNDFEIRQNSKRLEEDETKSKYEALSKNFRDLSDQYYLLQEKTSKLNFDDLEKAKEEFEVEINNLKIVQESKIEELVNIYEERITQLEQKANDNSNIESLTLLGNKYEDKIKEVHNLKADNDDLLLSIKSLQDKLNELDKEKSVLNNLLEAKNNLVLESQSMASLMELKNQQLTSSLYSKEKKIEELNLQISESGKNINLQQVSEIESNIELLNQKLKESEKQVDSLMINKKELEEVIKSRYSQIEMLENQLNSENEERRKEKKERELLANKIQSYIIKLESVIN